MMQRLISRRGVGWLVGAAAAVALGQVGLASPAVADTTTVVAGVTMTTPDRSLVGNQIVPVTVRLHLVDPDGVVPVPSWGWGYTKSYPCPCVRISTKRTVSAQGVPQRTVPLRLTAGTAQDGWWTGSAPLGTGQAGTWQAVEVRAGDLHGPQDPLPGDIGDDFVPLDPATVAASTLPLTGTDWPVVSLRSPTELVPAGSPYVVQGRLLLATSRRPVANAVVTIVHGPFTVLDCLAPQLRARTTATGAWAIQTSLIEGSWALLYRATSSCETNLIRTGVNMAFIHPVVTARASATSIRAGTAITIKGSVTPATGLRLFEYPPGSRWPVVVATMWNVPEVTTYAYTFRIVPPRGVHRYGVYASYGNTYRSTLSPVVTVRAS